MLKYFSNRFLCRAFQLTIGTLPVLFLTCGLVLAQSSETEKGDGNAKPNNAAPSISANTKAIAVRQAVDAMDSAIKPPNRWALVIGVAEYGDKDIADLPACVNDAQSIHQMLTDPLKGMFPKDHVKLLLDDEAKRENVIDALVWLKRQAAEDDLVVIYFSGHGAVDGEGAAFWLTQDSRLSNLRGTALEELNITRLTEEIPSQRRVILVDACFSGATVLPGTKAPLIDVSRLYQQFDGTGRVLISSSNGQEPSLVISDANHPGHGHSVFTWHLMDAMNGGADQNQDGVITLDEIWKHVSPAVKQTANKLGGKMTPNMKGQVGGELLFAVDSERLSAIQYQSEQESTARKERLRKLKELALDDLITEAQYREGKRLFELTLEEMSPADSAIRDQYSAVLNGTMSPDHLQSELYERTSPGTRNSVNGQIPVIGGMYEGRTPGQIRNDNGPRITLVWCPSGQFQAGLCEKDRSAVEFDEYNGDVVDLLRLTPRTVKFNEGFWIGQFAITVGQSDESKLSDLSLVESHKALCASLESANQFCSALTRSEQMALRLPVDQVYRLPTADEREYACRAGSTTRYFFGDDDELKHSYMGENSNRRPNAWGIFDLDSRPEWCSDAVSGGLEGIDFEYSMRNSMRPIQTQLGGLSGTRLPLRFRHPGAHLKGQEKPEIVESGVVENAYFRIVRSRLPEVSREVQK